MKKLLTVIGLVILSMNIQAQTKSSKSDSLSHLIMNQTPVVKESCEIQALQATTKENTKLKKQKSALLALSLLSTAVATSMFVHYNGYRR